MELDKYHFVFDNNDLGDYIMKLNKSEVLRDLNFKYFTTEEFNKNVNKLKYIELSIFHLNVRSLNSKHRPLCQLLELTNIDFDIIVLTEIWTTNIQFYSNILPGYCFYYDLPKHSKVGGVDLYIKKYSQTARSSGF